MRTKATILTSVTLLMSLGFFVMARKGIWVPCIILAVVWVCHVIYFAFGVKTIDEEANTAIQQIDDMLNEKRDNIKTES